MIHRIKEILKSQGMLGLAGAVGRRLFSARTGGNRLLTQLLFDRVGLEIGGPSQIFSRGGILEIYPVVRRLDNCVFNEKTIWQDDVSPGATFRYDARHKPGKQYIAEAADLSHLYPGSYDFLLASHVIEHIANPLRALLEWNRVLKETGVLVLVVPHKEGTFDHRRNVTALAHMIDDFENNTRESDLTHLSEILELHDLERDREEDGYEMFKMRSERNLENRCLHHHVFDTRLVIGMLDYIGFQISAVELLLPYHVVVVAHSIAERDEVNNSPFLHKQAEYRWRSPFAADRA